MCRIVGDTEAPDPIVGSDAMRQTLLQQPIQIAVESYPVHQLPGVLPQTLLQFLVAEGLAGIQQRLQDTDPPAGSTASRSSNPKCCREFWVLPVPTICHGSV